MLKVVIIDDEILVRLGLQKMINWEELGLAIVGEASDGQEGTELILSKRPDIVITDIKMPVMDGIEMIKTVTAANCWPQFIVLSSHSDFELVKQVMRLGVVDYIMKLNLDAEELKKLLMQVKENLNIESSRQSDSEELKEYIDSQKELLKDEFIRKLMLGVSDIGNKKKLERDIKHLEIKNDIPYYLLNVKLANESTSNPQEQQEGYLFYLVNICKQIVGSYFEDNLVIVNEDNVIIRVLSKTMEDKKIEEMSKKLAYMLQQYFSIRAVIGISAKHTKLEEISKAFHEATSAIEEAFMAKEDSIYFYKLSKKNIEEKIDVVDLRDNLMVAIEVGDEVNIRNIFEEIYRRMDNHHVLRKNAYEVCYKLVYLITLLDNEGRDILGQTFDKDYTNFSNIQEFTTINEVILWIKQLENGVCDYVNDKNTHIGKIKINKAKKYIQEHYTEKITLQEVADNLEISQGYLSALFKKVTGEYFADYVSEIKIKEAKRLLKLGEYKVYEVASLLGYEDSYYFSKVFKKYTGLTPTEYITKA